MKTLALSSWHAHVSLVRPSPAWHALLGPSPRSATSIVASTADPHPATATATCTTILYRPMHRDIYRVSPNGPVSNHPFHAEMMRSPQAQAQWCRDRVSVYSILAVYPSKLDQGEIHCILIPPCCRPKGGEHGLSMQGFSY